MYHRSIVILLSGFLLFFTGYANFLESQPSSDTIIVNVFSTYSVPNSQNTLSSENDTIVVEMDYYIPNSQNYLSSENNSIVVNVLPNYHNVTSSLVMYSPEQLCFLRVPIEITVNTKEVNGFSQYIREMGLCPKISPFFDYAMDTANGSVIIYDRDFTKFDAVILPHLFIEKDIRVFMDSQDLVNLGASVGTSTQANVLKENVFTEGFTDISITFVGPSVDDSRVDCLVGSDYCLFGFFYYGNLSNEILFIDYAALKNESVRLLLANAMYHWVTELGIKVLFRKCMVPMKNATIELYQDGNLVYTTTTDEYGIATLDVVEGIYDLVVYWNNQTLTRTNVFFHK